MNSGLIQDLRYKLQKRVRRLNSTGSETFHSGLIQFWGFLRSNPLLSGITEDIERRYPEGESYATNIVKSRATTLFNDELQHAAASYYVIKQCAETGNARTETVIGHAYNGERNADDALEFFKHYFLETLYEYIDEQLDTQRSILALLRRYKHKCEWFQREHLYNLWEDDTGRGEKKLARHLYEYLHDQGLDFSIEPASISGEADLVAAQNSDDPLIADAKIFNPGSGNNISYIAAGFNQIYTYTLDYNEPFGYLVIFKTCPEDIKFSLTNVAQSIPFVTHNNKTIFLLTVDISTHEKSASKRGRLKAWEITELNLISVVEEGRADIQVRVDGEQGDGSSAESA